MTTADARTLTITPLSCLLNHRHRRKAARRVARRLRSLAKDIGDLYSVETWLKLAEQLQIGVYRFTNPFGRYGRLVFVSAEDRWVIELNTVFSLYRQCYVMVHELAHYLLRTMRPDWLCDESIVYYYDGSSSDARHEIARRVEKLVLG